MKLNKVSIFGFGAVKDREFSLEPGMNLFHGANDSGKSSILNFILWMLYGPPDRDDQGQFAYLLQSFDQRTVGGELVYELDDGTPFRLRRLFNGASNNLILKNLTTDLDVTEELSSDGSIFRPPGERHLGLSRHLFEFICLFRRSPWTGEEQSLRLPDIPAILSDDGKADIFKQLLSNLDIRLIQYEEERIHRLRAETEQRLESLNEQKREAAERGRFDPETLERIRTIAEDMREITGRISEIALIHEAAERDQLTENINKIKEVRSRLEQLESRRAELAEVEKLSMEEEDRLTELLCRREALQNQEERLEGALRQLQSGDDPEEDAPPDDPRALPGVVATLTNMRHTLVDKKSDLVKKIHELGLYSLNIISREIEKEKKQSRRWFVLLCICFAMLLLYGILKENALYSGLTIILPILLIPVYIKMKNMDTILKKLVRRRQDLENDINRWKEKEKVEIADVPIAKTHHLLVSHRIYLRNIRSTESTYIKKLEIEVNQLKKEVSETEASIRDIFIRAHVMDESDKLTFKMIDSFISDREALSQSVPGRDSGLTGQITGLREKRDEARRELGQVNVLIEALLQKAGLEEGDHLKQKMDLAGEKDEIEDEIAALRRDYQHLLEEEPEGMIRRLDLLSLRTASVSVPPGQSGLSEFNEEREGLQNELALKREAYASLMGQIAAADSDMPDPASLELEIRAAEKKLQDVLREKEVLHRIRELLERLIRETENSALTRVNEWLSQTVSRIMPDEAGSWMVDDRFRVHYQASAGGKLTPAEHLGSAHRDFGKLVTGLAACALTCDEGEKPPLLLDEYLAFFDDRLALRCLDLLIEAASSRQVLFFSCKGRERDYLLQHAASVGQIFL